MFTDNTIRHNSHQGRCRGFTLIETASVIFILAILGTFTSELLVQAADAFADADLKDQNRQQLNQTLDRIVYEFTNMPANASFTPDISSTQAHAITFGNNVTIMLSGTSVVYSTGVSLTSPLIQSVDVFELVYLDDKGDTLNPADTNTPSKTRRIAIRLSKNQVELRAMVTPRVSFAWRYGP